MAITDEDRIRAEARMKEDPDRQARASEAFYDAHSGRIVVCLDSGLELAFRPDRAEGLERGTPSELSTIEVSPSGHGLHWPLLDVDLYIPSLLNGIFGSRKWMARTLGSTGGQAKSAAKVAASRANGKKGGRPRSLGKSA